MTDTPLPLALTAAVPTEQAFPKLTASQIERMAAHGRVRKVGVGEVLFDAGDETFPFFVVSEGQIEMVRMDGAQETIVVRHGPGQFTGEINMLSGRRALVRAR